MASVEQIRFELGDTDVTFPILSDAEIQYFLDKNSGSLGKTALDCARLILMKLSMRAGEETVDIFTVRGEKAAKAYMDAMKLYISNPYLNPLAQNLKGYFGGVSLADKEANEDNSDNNIVVQPSQSISFNELNSYDYLERGWE